MSSTLKMEQTNRAKKSLSYELKRAIQKKCAGVITNQIFDMSDINYFKGLLDAGIEDAQTVIDWIEKYEEVVLNEEF